MIAAAKTMQSDWPFLEETFQKWMAARKEPFPARLKADEVFKERVAEAKSKKILSVAFIDGGLDRLAGREAAALANLRLGMTMVALQRHFVAHGNQYPASLGELVPALLPSVPQDPFDGQALRYDRKGDGYELHSIGPEAAKPISFKVVKPPKE